jgi:hypothetical protein
MSFLKSTDYSGGRTYDGAPAARAVVDHFRLRIALNFAWARLKIARFMRFIAAPTSPSAPTARGFTMLGSKQPALPPRRRITDIFPIPNSDGLPRKTRNDSQSCL